MEFASHHSGAAHLDTDYNWFKERECASCEVNLDMVYSSGLCFKRNVQEICNSLKDDANFYCMHDFESSKSAWMHPLVLSFTSIQSLRILGPTKAALLSAMCVQPLNWDVAFMLSAQQNGHIQLKLLTSFYGAKSLWLNLETRWKSTVPGPVSLFSSFAK